MKLDMLNDIYLELVHNPEYMRFELDAGLGVFVIQTEMHIAVDDVGYSVDINPDIHPDSAQYARPKPRMPRLNYRICSELPSPVELGRDEWITRVQTDILKHFSQENTLQDYYDKDVYVDYYWKAGQLDNITFDVAKILWADALFRFWS